MTRCECDCTGHQGQPCPNEAADLTPLRSSPELCTLCLYVCEAERDDEIDAAPVKS